MRKSLENYIHNLWHWLKMTPRQYAECCGTGDPEPYMFPEWEKMLDEVCSLIKRGGLFPADMDCLLTMMALDDETEDVLDCTGRRTAHIRPDTCRAAQHISPGPVAMRRAAWTQEHPRWNGAIATVCK